MFGELIPQGGGDPIPLFKDRLLVGRREKCDIVLRFSNVSGKHCEFILSNGYWYVQDAGSRNGIKVNGARVKEKRVDPGDVVSIAKHNYEVSYSPGANGAVGPPPPEILTEDIFGKSLLQRAGLERDDVDQVKDQDASSRQSSYDISADMAEDMPRRK